MTPTPVYALPRPVATDRVRDGWDAISDLADAVEAALLAYTKPVFVLKAADQSVVASASSVFDTHLVGMAFPANSTWECELYLEVGGTGSETGDIRINWASTTGGAVVGTRHCLGIATNEPDNTDTDVVLSARAGADIVSYGVDDSATSRGSVREKFLVTTTTAGTISLRWSQAVASGTTTVRAGSWFLARRIA